MKTAFTVSLLLLALSLSLSYTLRPIFALYALGLFVSSMIYTLWVEDIAFADIHVIALNFLIRAVAGAAAIRVPASPWLIATVYFMALFLAIAKRKGDLALLSGSAVIIARKTQYFFRDAQLTVTFCCGRLHRMSYLCQCPESAEASSENQHTPP